MADSTPLSEPRDSVLTIASTTHGSSCDRQGSTQPICPPKKKQRKPRTGIDSVGMKNFGFPAASDVKYTQPVYDASLMSCERCLSLKLPCHIPALTRIPQPENVTWLSPRYSRRACIMCVGRGRACSRATDKRGKNKKDRICYLEEFESGQAVTGGVQETGGERLGVRWVDPGRDVKEGRLSAASIDALHERHGMNHTARSSSLKSLESWAAAVGTIPETLTAGPEHTSNSRIAASSTPGEQGMSLVTDPAAAGPTPIRRSESPSISSSTGPVPSKTIYRDELPSPSARDQPASEGLNLPETAALSPYDTPVSFEPPVGNTTPVEEVDESFTTGLHPPEIFISENVKLEANADSEADTNDLNRRSAGEISAFIYVDDKRLSTTATDGSSDTIKHGRLFAVYTAGWLAKHCEKAGWKRGDA